MLNPTSEHRRFSVHARHVDRHHARILVEPTFEAAAVAYVEDFTQSAGDDAAVSVIVRDVESGHERVFRVDVETGDADMKG